MFRITAEEKSFILEQRAIAALKILGAVAKNIKVKNPGMLEVPEGKNVTSLTKAHILKLVKSKGKSAITKAIQNLKRWNKNKRTKSANAIRKWANSAQKWVTDAP